MTSRVNVATFALFISAGALAFPSRAGAQEPGARGSVAATTADVSIRHTTSQPVALGRADIERAVRALPQVSRANVAPIERVRTVSALRRQERGAGRIIAGAAVGAVGGLFAGGYLGAKIDGECGGCDDPGLIGALIGAPTGAIVGGILGGKFLF